MTLCTIFGCSSVHNLLLQFPALNFSFAVTFLFVALCVQCSCITVASMSLVEKKDIVVQELWCWGGGGRVVCFLLSALHLHFFNSDQYNTC